MQIVQHLINFINKLLEGFVISGHHLVLEESPQPFDQVEIGRIGWQEQEFNIGILDMLSDDLGVVVTCVVENENDATCLWMAYPNFIFGSHPSFLNQSIPHFTHQGKLEISPRV